MGKEMTKNDVYDMTCVRWVATRRHRLQLNFFGVYMNYRVGKVRPDDGNAIECSKD